jgi:hypothetical protein
MITDNAEIAAALTETQALLSLVADKLVADALPAYELFTLHVTVRMAMNRLNACHDVLYATHEAQLVAQSSGAVQ